MSVALRSLCFVGALFSTFFEFPEPVTAESKKQSWIGISAFGIQSNRFQGRTCINFLRAINQSPKPAIAILFETFGKNPACLQKFWNNSRNLARPHLTEIHFSNEAGRRMQTQDRFDFHYELNISEYNTLLEAMPKWFEQEIRERVRRILDLIEGYEDTGSYILSTGLEDNYSSLAWNNLYKILREEWPWQLARNMAWTKNMRRQEWYIPSDLYREYHGYNKTLQNQGLCIANGDGQDMAFLQGGGVNFATAPAASRSEVKKWIKKAKSRDCVIFLWAAKWQGFFSSKGAVPPLQRTFRFDESDILVLKSLFTEESQPPSD